MTTNTIEMHHDLCKAYGFDERGREERLALIGLDRQDVTLAPRLHEQVIVPGLAAIIDEFYAYLLGNPHTLAFLDSAALIAHLKEAQSDYLLTLGMDFAGVDYFEDRLRIGLAHASIGLPLSLYLCAYGHLQQLILGRLTHAVADRGEPYRELTGFVVRITMLDMSLAAEVYHQTRMQGLEDDIRDLRKEHARLSWQVQFDELTNVTTRTYALSVLDKQLARREAGGSGLSVIMADLDHFKAINDTHGHLVGDHALRESAARIRAAVRGFDVVGRYGGEEFIILLLDATADIALAVADRIRRKISDHPVHVDEVCLHMTISLGCAHAEPDDDTDSLIARADDALYSAKRAGRDRVIVHEKAARR